MPVRRICNCHNPPGGTVTCEPHQTAMCFVLDGEARRECYDTPPSGTHAELVDWAVAQITEGSVSFQTREAQLLMLSQGYLERPDGTIVTFALPDSIQNAVASLVGDVLKAQVQEPEHFSSI